MRVGLHAIPAETILSSHATTDLQSPHPSTARPAVPSVPTTEQMKDVLGEALLSFRLLKVGGVMVFDDNWMRGVARAAAAFEEALGDILQVLHRDEVSTNHGCCRGGDEEGANMRSTCVAKYLPPPIPRNEPISLSFFGKHNIGGDSVVGQGDSCDHFRVVRKPRRVY